MLVRIKPIGNSLGVILPKTILQLSQLEEIVEIEVEVGMIRLVEPLRAETSLMADPIFRSDWQRPGEDAAWSSIQPDR